MLGGQVVSISSRATSFTAVCELCSGLDAASGCSVMGYGGSTFAGRLDLDLRHGTFLCRRGHTVQVERAGPDVQSAAASAA